MKLKDTDTRELLSDGIRDINDAERSVELSFSSDSEVNMGFFREILDHSANSVKLDRLRQTGCLLFNHDRNKVIGRLDNIRVEDGKCRARAIFDSDAESDVIWQKVKSGTLRGTSVSYRRLKVEEQKTDRHELPLYRTRLWEPLEASIVSVPADAGVGVGRGLAENDNGAVALSVSKCRTQINKNKMLYEVI